MSARVVEGVRAMLLLVAGTVIWVLGVFLTSARYRRTPKPVHPVDRARLEKEVEDRMSELAPGAILLAERERRDALTDRGPAEEFWRRFALASALVDEDPGAALRELRGLSGLLEIANQHADGGAGSVHGISERREERA